MLKSLFLPAMCIPNYGFWERDGRWQYTSPVMYIGTVNHLQPASHSTGFYICSLPGMVKYCWRRFSNCIFLCWAAAAYPASSGSCPVRSSSVRFSIILNEGHAGYILITQKYRWQCTVNTVHVLKQKQIMKRGQYLCLYYEYLQYLYIFTVHLGTAHIRFH
jgi:hypothetical protein